MRNNMKDTILVFKNASGETVAFKLERLGRYRDVHHLEEIYPESKIITPDQLPKELIY